MRTYERAVAAFPTGFVSRAAAILVVCFLRFYSPAFQYFDRISARIICVNRTTGDEVERTENGELPFLLEFIDQSGRRHEAGLRYMPCRALAYCTGFLIEGVLFLGRALISEESPYVFPEAESGGHVSLHLARR